MVSNVIDCDNGQVNKEEISFEGEYPKCFFGLSVVEVDSNYDRPLCYPDGRKTPNDAVPDWLRSSRASSDCADTFRPLDGLDRAKWTSSDAYNCLINIAHQDTWNDRGLARSRTVWSSEGLNDEAMERVCGLFSAHRKSTLQPCPLCSCALC